MTNQWLGGISALRADNAGALHRVKQPLPNGGDGSSAISPQQVITAHQGRSIYFLYQGFARYGKSASAPEGDLEAVFSEHQAKPSGRLRSLTPAKVQCPGTPQEAAVDPKSRYCYLFLAPQYLDGYPINTDKIIAARYVIRTDGSLGQRTQQTLTAPDGLFCPAFDQSGQTLYLLTRRGISLFHVSRDGSIAPLGAASVSTGHGPLRMVCVRRR